MSAGSEAAVFPPILWAQRPEFLLVSIPLPDATDVSVEVRDGRVLHFRAVAGGRRYACALPLFADVVSEESRHATLPRGIELQLRKRPPPAAEAEGEAGKKGEREGSLELSRAWPRLTQDKSRNPRIQVDWTRWKDDDDDNDDPNGFDGQDGFGMNYEDLMSQMTTQKGFDENDLATEKNSTGVSVKDDNNNTNNNKNTNNEDEDFDDLPPLEE
ncbi:CS domain [Trypanosoma melophagium]|uniref:CS domain n=1 Tax=Trypanosoma melophagium TaxID=715481 RepID=UPI00351A755E|nr:CS domain [Trypanosoma melophagium]